jgi:DNA-binding NtrC family response regulator/tetratricopeptide (TPR) repeat protein
MPLLAELRSNATKLGDPHISAAVHIYVGEMEAKRGFLASALWHTRLGQRMLISAPNVWLESVAENTQVCVALMRSATHQALEHSRIFMDLSEQSGRAATRRAALGNLGNLLYLVGDFDSAVKHFEDAIAALPSAGEHCNASLDGIARIRLTQSQIDECGRLLDRIDESLKTPKDRTLFAHRYTLLTRIQLLARQSRFDDALAASESLESVANRSGDHLLFTMALLTKAELLQQTNRLEESTATLDTIVMDLLVNPPELHAHYERILACALAAGGNTDAARTHYERSKRIYSALSNVPGTMELSRCWDLAISRAAGPEHRATRADEATRARTILQRASALMLHAARPELLAAEIVDMLTETDCVRGAAAIARDNSGQVHLLASSGVAPSATTPPSSIKRIAVGVDCDRTVELFLDPKPDVESAATLNAITILLATVHDLERARAEREERLTLWPIEDVQTEDGRAVVSGHMREVMTFARRIATTNVAVLITGESGTGKEIVARAVHGFSDRAQKPFIPFNCTAIPREMLESQLFGHRRGSFTGADRDNPGLIRSAREGTLFLDEVGELGLDLQPKLLRFLESGEICPLGDSTPFTVDVRILAATNSNLEQLVKDGRFREDLFYRLNVIRLRIAPLRERRDEIPGLVNYFVGRAAEEFRKGAVRLAEETMEYLLLYTWPGNVRQLHNELRRMVALAERDSVLTPAQLSDEILKAKPASERRVNGSEIVVPLHDKLAPTLSKIECEMVRAALREHKGKVDAAAKALGISRKGLYLKRQRLGL